MLSLDKKAECFIPYLGQQQYLHLQKTLSQCYYFLFNFHYFTEKNVFYIRAKIKSNLIPNYAKHLKGF